MDYDGPTLPGHTSPMSNRPRLPGPALATVVLIKAPSESLEGADFSYVEKSRTISFGFMYV